jgi:hypothetical protein
MGVKRFRSFGLLGVAVAAAVALGAELQRPAAVVDSHSMRNTAASRLINDPRLARVLSQSAQRALAPLKSSSSDLNPPPITHAAPDAARPASTPDAWITSNPPLAFNNDRSGLPQNTESVTNCSADGTVVGAYDDYRNQAINSDLSAWSISTNGGKSLKNSNFLPGIHANVVVSGPVSGPKPTGAGGTGGGGGTASGSSHVYVPTQGDPVVRATESCDVYATSLAFSYFSGPFVNAVVVEKSNKATLASCSSENACWPTRRPIVLNSDGTKFFDKPTIAVFRNSPFAPVFIGFTEFSFDEYGNATFSVDVVRCDSQLIHCSGPVAVETDFPFGGPSGAGAAGGGGGGGGFVTPTWTSIGLGSDGTTYVSWVTIQQFFGPTTLQIKIASAPAGTLKFRSPVLVTQVDQPVLPPVASEIIQANGYPELAVSHVGGVDRLHIVFGRCRAEVLGICEHAETQLATSRTGATGTWSVKTIDPGANSDFLPALTVDASTGGLLAGFLTTRFDPAQQRFDVLAVPIDAATGAPSAAIRLTSTSIEPDNDSLIPYTIGDYWELTASGGTAWAHFTTTQRTQKLLGQGVAIPQQDNALVRFTY